MNLQSVVGWIGSVVVAGGCGMQDDQQASAELTQAVATSCTRESDCPVGQACTSGVCGRCTAHSQCESDTCDRYAPTSAGLGACVAESSVVYARAAGGPGCQTGDGTRADPACSIIRAIAFAVGDRYAIRVYPGSYFPFRVTQRTVYVFGPGDGSAIVGEEDSSVGIRVDQSARAVIDGIDVGGGVLTGATVTDAEAQFRDATIRGDSRGIVSTNSKLLVDRARVIGSARVGLEVDGAGSYRVTNSYFAGGFLPGVVFSGTSTGCFLFNSVLGGGEDQPGGINCGTTPRAIQDSIVVGNTPAAGGAQTVGACTHQRVVVGSADLRGDPGLIHIDPELDGDGRLLDTAGNAACCIDRGARFVSSLYTDFFGTPRPQGASNDIGAHELR